MPVDRRVIWARRLEISSSMDSIVVDLEANSAVREEGGEIDIEGEEPWREVLAWSWVFWRWRDAISAFCLGALAMSYSNLIDMAPILVTTTYQLFHFFRRRAFRCWA